MEADEHFNPLDKTNLGKSIVEALLSSNESPLEDLKDFPGAGIYAIYYRGDYEAYLPLAAVNQETGIVPIYVGKAVPKGGRKGLATKVSSKSRTLFRRLQEHAKSIEAVPSLKLADFTCRKLVVDDIWIPLGEALVIQRFLPLWNTVVEGFGNHDPGAGRYRGKRPAWDEIHPGRSWAEKCQTSKISETEILKLIEGYTVKYQDSESEQ